MENHILGLHHLTAIADNAKRNVDFHRDTLGLRFVKKTVTFNDQTPIISIIAIKPAHRHHPYFLP